jgi:hypothetical protein
MPQLQILKGDVQMLRRVSLMTFVLVLSLAVAVPVFADQPDNVGGGLGNKAPNFSAGVYADGEAWGTKGTTTLPAPNGKNDQSFDMIFVIGNGAEGQLPVGEAAPGNPMYNGGRWWVQAVEWTEEGLAAHDPLPVLKSYDEVMLHYSLGHLSITDAQVYFQCPLLPVK